MTGDTITARKVVQNMKVSSVALSSHCTRAAQDGVRRRAKSQACALQACKANHGRLWDML